MAKHRIVLSGEITVLPEEGARPRVLYEYDPESAVVRPGLTHLQFRPINPILKAGAIALEKISVHFLPKSEPFPDSIDDIERLQKAWGLELAPEVDPITSIVPTISVGVNTTWLTNDTADRVDCHWRAILTFAE